MTRYDSETSEAASGSSTALAKTPARALAFASSVPLPPSPAEVASHIDRQTARVRSSLRKAVKQSGVSERVDTVRDTIRLHTSVFIPLFFAYFFNLALKAKHGGAKNAKNLHPLAQYDPLTFNLAKGVTTWLVYSKHFSMIGFPSAVTAAKIDYYLPGGWYGVLVGAGIGTITSIYEAILRK